MKKLVLIFVVFLSFSSFSQNVTNDQAKKILGNRFVTITEARKIFPDLPEKLEIPYPAQKLQNDFTSWLVPVKIKGTPQYLLIQASYPLDSLVRNKEEINKCDTLELEEAGDIVYLLNKLRPNFPNRGSNKDSIKYFYRTKEPAPSKLSVKFKKALNYNIYNDGDFLIVNLPDEMQAGSIDLSSIYYLKNKNSLGIIFLSNSLPPLEKHIISVLTLTYAKP